MIYKIDISLRIDKKNICAPFIGARDEEMRTTLTRQQLLCAGLVQAAVLVAVFG